MERKNKICPVCLTEYQVCNSCNRINSYTPWRSVTDTIDCFRIHIFITNLEHGVLGDYNGLDLSLIRNPKYLDIENRILEIKL